MSFKALGKNFWLFVIGRFVSQFGWAVQDVAIPLYVLDKTHSGSMMAIFVLAEMLPFAILPLAGVISDRYNRKNMMVAFDLGRGAILIGVVALGFLSVMQLLWVTIVLAFMGAFFSAATNAMFPELVPENELERANSMASTFNIVAMLIGPAFGGFLYGIGGIMLPVLINGLSFFGSGIFEIVIKYKARIKKITKASEMIKDLKDGLRFLKNSKYLVTLIGFAVFLNALGQPFASVLLPYSIREVLRFSSIQFGLLGSAFMGGAIAGNLLIAFRVVKNSGKYLFRSLDIAGVMLLILIWLISPFATFHGNVVFMILMGVSIVWGSSEAFLNVPINTKIQKAVPNEYRGRVLSVFVVLVNSLAPVGLVVVGPLLDSFPAWSVGLSMVVIMAIFVFYYWLKHKVELTQYEPSLNEN